MPLHIAVKGGKKHLPFAKKKLKELKRGLGSPQSFTKIYEMGDGTRVIIKKTFLTEHIIIEGGYDLYCMAYNGETSETHFLLGLTKSKKLKKRKVLKTLVPSAAPWTPNQIALYDGGHHYLGDGVTVTYTFKKFNEADETDFFRNHPKTHKNAPLAITFHKNFKAVGGVIVNAGFVKSKALYRGAVNTIPVGRKNGKMIYATIFPIYTGTGINDNNLVQYVMILFDDTFNYIKQSPLPYKDGHFFINQVSLFSFGNGKVAFGYATVNLVGSSINYPDDNVICVSEDFCDSWKTINPQDVNMEMYLPPLGDAESYQRPNYAMYYLGNDTIIMINTWSLGTPRTYKTTDWFNTFELKPTPYENGMATSDNYLADNLQGNVNNNMVFGEGCLVISNIKRDSVSYTLDYGETWTRINYDVANPQSSEYRYDNIIFRYMYPIQIREVKDGKVIDPVFVAVKILKNDQGQSIGLEIVESRDYFKTWNSVSEIDKKYSNVIAFDAVGDLALSLSEFGDEIGFYKAFPDLYKESPQQGN